MPKRSDRDENGEAYFDMPRADFVYQELTKAIREGHYHPGERIREASVAEELQVSRTPVREALRRLQSEGRVTIEPQRGAVVAQLDRQEVVELYEWRQQFEGVAARFAAQHASTAEIEQLAQILARSDAAAGDARALNQINWEFHNGLYQAAHNRFLLRAIGAIADALAMLRGARYIPPGRPQQLLKEHMAILDAIRARKPDEAEHAAKAHLQNSLLVHLQTAFSNNGG